MPFTAGGIIKATVIGAFSAAVTYGIGEATAAITQLVPRVMIRSLLNTAFSTILPQNPIPGINVKLGNWNFTISPAIAFGESLGIGANVGIGFDDRHFSASYGFGIMGWGNHSGTGNSGIEIRNSFMVGYRGKDFGVSLGTNFWSGGVTDGNPQRTGTIGLSSGDWGFRYENDGAPFGGWSGDGGDSYRTAALQFKIGEFSAGFNLFTGRRDDYSGDEKKVGSNALGLFGERMPNGFVNEKGTPYRFGGAYIGYGNFRFGINSDRYVRHPIQDNFAHNLPFSRQPGFYSYSNSILPYFQYKTENPFTSW